MKRNILLFFIFLLLLLNFPISLKAESTNKNEFPYEISNISMDQNFITIKGWGMVVNKHHYDSTKTHDYELILESNHEKLVYSSKPHYNSQTDTMRYLGVDKCKVDEYYQKGTSCYYNYDYTGFEFKIPLSDLNIGDTYDSKLIIHSNILLFSNETYVFYPILSPLIQMKDKIKYEVNSSLYDTTLKVADFGVFDRIEPTKNSKIRQTNTMCSSNFRYNRYFDKNSVYLNIYDRYVNESTIFYKVKTGVSTTCKLGRNVVSEGNTYESWIAGNWVDFSGEPMQIKVIDTNQAPKINILNHPTISIYDIDNFNFKDYIQSIDKEDGDITYKTIIVNEINLNDIGTFNLNLEVEDSNGKKASQTLIVKVIDDNTPPIINANDSIVYQYDEFDYLQNVSANDLEDGNIDHTLTYEGRVDTNSLGEYKVTYYAHDSKNKITSKTINVTVIKNPKEKIRYISTNQTYLFYKKDLPTNWKDKIEYLIEQLENPKVFITNKFSK